MQTHHHYILHKPYGFLSQFISHAPKNHKQKFLGELYDFADGTMSIGRLDEKSEGLLLLTTDGRVSNEITSRKFEKEYYVQMDGVITPTAMNELCCGVEIGLPQRKYTTAGAKVSKIDVPGFPERSRKVRDDRHGPTSWASITINEGKYHQVRKMCAAVGFPVLRLIRIRIGALHLRELPVGRACEVASLIDP